MIASQSNKLGTKSEKEIIESLKTEGYNPVYTWHAAPHEEDLEHEHDFDTTLHALTGSIRIKVLNGGRVDDHLLVAGQQFDIPRKRKHSAIVNPEGCTYIVAEKH